MDQGKSITRKQLIDNYCQSSYPHIAGKTLKEKSICLYTELLTDINQSHTDLDRYMRSIAPARAPRDLEKSLLTSQNATFFLGRGLQ